METSQVRQTRTMGQVPPMAAGVNQEFDFRLLCTVRSMVDCALADMGPLADGEKSSAASRYRAMLTVLTYGYAVGTYGSKDIELMLLESAPLRVLLRPDLPDADELRRFRRRNRTVLLRCLSTTLRRFGGIDPVAQSGEAGNLLRLSPQPDVDVSETELRRLSFTESMVRIQRAARVDSIRLDE